LDTQIIGCEMTQADQPLVVVLVLNWNLPDITIKCVDSLLESDYTAMRVAIIDNGSDDDSIDRFSTRYGATVSVLQTGQNLYYAGGNNAGLQWAYAAGAEFCLVLNNDTIVAKDTVRWMVCTALSSANAGVVSPLIYDGTSGTRIWSAGGVQRTWIPFPREVARADTLESNSRCPYLVDFVTGCAMMIRRVALETVGYFDPAYRMYYEDADYCVRLRRAGYTILVDPRATVWHSVSLSSTMDSALSRYHRVRYRLRFYRRHYSCVASWLACLLVVAQETWRSMLALRHGHAGVAWAAVRGLLDGLLDAVKGVGERHVDL